MNVLNEVINGIQTNNEFVTGSNKELITKEIHHKLTFNFKELLLHSCDNAQELLVNLLNGKFRVQNFYF